MSINKLMDKQTGGFIRWILINNKVNAILLCPTTWRNVKITVLGK